MSQPTQVSLLTPPGRGAVAVIAVRGSRAMPAVADRFHAAGGRPLASLPADRVVVGWWEHRAGTREEVVVCRRGPEDVEVHCHGGHAAAQAILEHLVQAGCRQVPWQAWRHRNSPAAIAAEAVVALSAARTERTAAILLDQLRGALETAVQRVLAGLDTGDAAGARAELRRIRGAEPLGTHLTRAWQVVLAGRPNVGKSRLINALLGYPRALVFDQPGTTRDVLTAVTAAEGWPVELADTAGLRETGDPLEAAGAESARKRIAAADLVLLVFDLSSNWTPADELLLRQWPHGLVVHSKADRVVADAAPRPPGIATSAVTRQGLETLLAEIARRLVPSPPPPGAAVPFCSRQRSWLWQAEQALDAGNAARAADCLRALLAGAEPPPTASAPAVP